LSCRFSMTIVKQRVKASSGSLRSINRQRRSVERVGATIPLISTLRRDLRFVDDQSVGKIGCFNYIIGMNGLCVGKIVER
ncbi:MAG TPA: hypothetical protein VGL25_12790, partial [Casimicrobiaceae bacterium]